MISERKVSDLSNKLADVQVVNSKLLCDNKNNHKLLEKIKNKLDFSSSSKNLSYKTDPELEIVKKKLEITEAKLTTIEAKLEEALDPKVNNKKKGSVIKVHKMTNLSVPASKTRSRMSPRFKTQGSVSPKVLRDDSDDQEVATTRQVDGIEEKVQKQANQIGKCHSQ